MLIDKLLKLGNAQDVTDADAYTTDVIDFGNPTVKRRVGNGEPLSLVFVVTTAPAGDSASITDTIDFIAAQSVNENMSSHDEIIKRRVPASELVAGKVVEIPLPIDRPTKRWFAGRVELGTGDTISVTSFLIPRDQVPAFVAYSKGYAI